MNVLSLFDGMSCGQIALERAGIKVDKYYASEIDKYAIQVSKSNYPNIIQLGDITKWMDWNIDWSSINLIIGGSPCQGFSFAGKQLNFEDPRSKLFFVFVDILNHIKKVNPNIEFLLENVKMKKEYQDVISSYLGVEPISINSKFFSAQSRPRLYWTNFFIASFTDKNILLSDILIPEIGTDRVGAAIRGRRLNSEGTRSDYDFSIHIKQMVERRVDNKSNCLTSVQKDNVIEYIKVDKSLILKVNQDKAGCLTAGAHSGGNHSDMDILIIPEATKKGYIEVQPLESYDGTFPNSTTRIGLLMKDKSNCLTATKFDFYRYLGNSVIRRYTPVECERLQTVPDNYTQCVSDSQRYKMLGNGWTVDVIAHILKGLKNVYK